VAYSLIFKNQEKMSYLFKPLFNTCQWLVLFVLFYLTYSCKKIVQTGPPSNTITTREVFSDSTDAEGAIKGIYAKIMGQGGMGFGSGAVSLQCGLSADEFLFFYTDDNLTPFQLNTLQSGNGLLSNFWTNPYAYIYQTNACIEGLANSTVISSSAKSSFSAEAKFLRAFCYFYLVNLFGDVPLITTTDYKKSGLASRSPKDSVYQLIKSDLLYAQSILGDDYTATSGERIRANKWAATALLARVYLYLHDWPNAVTQSSALINNTSLFSLNKDINQVFLKNNPEAIWQWQQNINYSPYNATTEGSLVIPYDNSSPPSFYMTQDLLDAFEPNDQRKTAWVDSTTFDKVYYYSYKYKTGPAQIVPKQDATEYYTIFRLAEQYLIRAEAEANLGSLNEAAQDIDAIRERAMLNDLPSNLNQTQLLAAVAQERRIELFGEWGHRWLDLKRTGAADSVLSIVKPSWKSYQQLYPIPLSDIQTDPNLVQNPGGYN
jgi:hypothetical protein